VVTGGAGRAGGPPLELLLRGWQDVYLSEIRPGLQCHAVWSASDSRAGMLILLDNPVQKNRQITGRFFTPYLPVCFSVAP
jgi:hypothetical protein